MFILGQSFGDSFIASFVRRTMQLLKLHTKAHFFSRFRGGLEKFSRKNWDLHSNDVEAN